MVIGGRPPATSRQHALEEALSRIPDPEIPVITIADLGVLRSVVVDQDRAIVQITPTYSGCPAMDQIRDDIVAAGQQLGYAVEVETVYAPAWTTDWLSDDAKRRLDEFGIAPPDAEVVCPQCRAGDVSELSRFASTACKALWACADCGEPFDRFKVI